MSLAVIDTLTHLRDYQRECLAASRAAFDRGVWSQLAVSAVGSGKTVIFAHLRQAYSDWLAQFPPLQQKVLVLAHRDRLLDQAAEKIRHYNRDIRVGIEQGTRHYAPFDDVVIASVPTLVAGSKRRLQRMQADDFRIIVIDEAHRSAADSYQDVLRYFGLLPPRPLTADATSDDASAARTRVRAWRRETWPNRLLLGVTATPNRSDALGLEWTYDEVVYERGIRWYIERGYLAPLTGFVVKTDISLDGCRKVAGDFAQGQLAQLVNTPARNRAAVEAWMQTAATRQATLAFCVDVQHARDLASAFRAAGIAADSIAGEDGDRDARMADFERGDLQVLCNCQLLTEGVDIPRIDCVLMAAPTQSQIRYVQAIGRGTRLAPGKTDCLVLDVVDDARKYTLQTSGDIFGLPRRFNAQGANLLTCARAVEAVAETQPAALLLDDLTPERLRVEVRRLDLFAVARPEGESIGRMDWLELAPNHYSVTLPARAPEGEALQSQARALPEVVRVTQGMLGGWSAAMTSGAAVMAILATEQETRAEAVQRAERWVEMHRPDAWRMRQRDARWRGREASDKQIATLRKMGATIPPEGLTRGQASDMLDAYFQNRRRR